MNLSLAAIAFLVFINAIFHPFVHDDLVFIVQNPNIHRLDQWLDVFSHIEYQSSAGVNAYYRPVLEIFYRLEYQLFGFNPAGYHLVNILLHIINGLVLFALLGRLQLSKWMAYGITLLFLIHPVQTEAVACVAGISNVLVAFFILMALYFYTREEFIVVFASLTLAFLTKEQALMAPFLLVLIDLYQPKKNKYGLWALLFIFTIGMLWIRGQVTGARLIEDIFQSPGELRLRLLAIPRTILLYLRMIIAPVDLHYYRNTDILQPNAWGFYLLGGLMAGISFLAFRIKANGRLLFLGAAWFLLALMPVLNIVPLVNEYSFILTAEHFLYLPIIGVGMMAASLLPLLVPKRAWVAMGIVAVLGFGALSSYQNTFWRAQIPLFERMIRYEPQFGQGHILLAQAYESDQQWDRAIEHYTKALEIMTVYAQRSVNRNATLFYQGFIKGLNGNLAQCYMNKGAWQQSLDHYQKALTIEPHDPSILNNIALCYLQLEDKLQAEQYFKMALGIDPTFAPARDNLNKLIGN